MGMYTELNMHVALKKNTNSSIIDILKYMTTGDKYAKAWMNGFADLDHDIFNTSRWDWMLQSDSYLFPATTHSELNFDGVTEQYFLDIQCNFENYNDELMLFLCWLNPYIDAKEDEYIGYWRTEEDLEPRLLHYFEIKC